MTTMSNSLLGGALTAAPASGSKRSAATRLRRGLPHRVKAAVNLRDCGICRCCGLQMAEFQDVIVLDGVGLDPDRMATACVFCHQCFHLDLVPEMRSGVLVWLPEVEQVALHQLARDLYILRLSHGDAATKARRALDHVMTRREQARERLAAAGQDTEITDLIGLLRQPHGDPVRAERLSGIRLMPLDRRILREGDLEYNQFPKILAYWSGQLRRNASARAEAVNRVERYLRDVAGEWTSAPPAAPAAAGATNGAGHGVDAVTLPVTGYNWAAVEADRRVLLLKQVGSVIDGSLVVNPESTRIEAARLSFYDGALLRLTDDSWPLEQLAIYYLYVAGTLHRLDGTAPPVHRVNATTRIRLNRDNVLDYLRFFCFFVRADAGPFHLAESLEDPVLPRNLNPTAQLAVAQAVRPATYDGQDDRGRFLCSATVYYGDTMFASTFVVDDRGVIEMMDDTAVASHLPVHGHAPLTYEQSR